MEIPFSVRKLLVRWFDDLLRVSGRHILGSLLLFCPENQFEVIVLNRMRII